VYFYSIADFERAINYWRERQSSGEDFAVCPRARVLADVYGWMIWHQAGRVPAHTLSPAQNEALNLALSQSELSL
jgi:hypothetical protein